MITTYIKHNQHWESLQRFREADPHLHALSNLQYQHSSRWWQQLDLDVPGIYMLTGGRQVGKSTSCKQLIEHCVKEKIVPPQAIFYLPCDEIFDAKTLSQTLRFFLDQCNEKKFLLIIDEITFVKDWDRVIKALSDEAYFQQGVCLLTGSDALILKEAAMRFPGRRGTAAHTDFHLYALSFRDYVHLLTDNKTPNNQQLATLFNDYLLCGGYLRAINDIAQHGDIMPATFLTYEQWIRGDFLKQGKNEAYLMLVLGALLTVGVSQISYSKLTQKIGLMSKETCMDYMRLLERMDVIISLPAFDSNKKQGFPRKDRKFHFCDPFITRTLYRWLQQEGQIHAPPNESTLVEACVAAHCHRGGKTFYLKGQGEIDIIWLKNNITHAIEVKWTQQTRPNDLNMLKQFKNAQILHKPPRASTVDNIHALPVYRFLYELELDNI